MYRKIKTGSDFVWTAKVPDIDQLFANLSKKARLSLTKSLRGGLVFIDARWQWNRQCQS
jgi:hypothetical protein